VLARRLADLEARQAELLGLQRADLLPHARLIPARLVARDTTWWQETMLMHQGSFRGVRRGQWVATRLILDVGTDAGIEKGMAVLARQALIGQIEAVAPYTARVKLLTDPTSRLPVRLARSKDGTYRPLDLLFLLVGAGPGKMVIDDVPARLVDEKRISVGDVVLAEPAAGAIPVPLVAGYVRQLEKAPAHPLLYRLLVSPAVDLDTIRQAYIIDAQP